MEATVELRVDTSSGKSLKFVRDSENEDYVLVMVVGYGTVAELDLDQVDEAIRALTLLRQPMLNTVPEDVHEAFPTEAVSGNVLRCGKLSEHEEHDWNFRGPSGLTLHCKGVSVGGPA